MKNITAEIINSELKEFYINNPKKILSILRVGFTTQINVNNKLYEGVIAEDMYRQYAYFLILDPCDLYQVNENVYAIKYTNRYVKKDIIYFTTAC